MHVTANTCEVLTQDGWRAVELSEARARYAMALKRCPACHGAVAVAGTYTATVKLALWHRRSHTGCPLQSKVFSGVASRHPQAVA